MIWEPAIAVWHRIGCKTGMSRTETTVTRTVIIAAPQETVWKAIEETGLSRLHLLEDKRDTPLVEGRVMSWSNPEDAHNTPLWKGRITIISPPRRIAFMAFLPALGIEDVPENYTLVDMTLKTEDDGRTSVTVEHGDFAVHPQGPRHAKQIGNSWVEALIRLKEQVERSVAA